MEKYFKTFKKSFSEDLVYTQTYISISKQSMCVYTRYIYTYMFKSL